MHVNHPSQVTHSSVTDGTDQSPQTGKMGSTKVTNTGDTPGRRKAIAVCCRCLPKESNRKTPPSNLPRATSAPESSDRIAPLKRMLNFMSRRQLNPVNPQQRETDPQLVQKQVKYIKEAYQSGDEKKADLSLTKLKKQFPEIFTTEYVKNEISNEIESEDNYKRIVELFLNRKTKEANVALKIVKGINTQRANEILKTVKVKSKELKKTRNIKDEQNLPKEEVLSQKNLQRVMDKYTNEAASTNPDYDVANAALLRMARENPEKAENIIKKLYKEVEDAGNYSAANAALASYAKVNAKVNSEFAERAGKILYNVEISLQAAEDLANKIDADLLSVIVRSATGLEIQKESSAGTLLRKNSSSTRLAKAFANKHVLPLLVKSGEFIDALKNLPDDILFMSRHPKTHQDEIPENRIELAKQHVQGMLEAIIKGLKNKEQSKDLQAFFALCRGMCSDIEKCRFDDFKESSGEVTALNNLFLRLLNPLMSFPPLLKEHAPALNDTQKSNAKTVGVIIQNIINRVPFGVQTKDKDGKLKDTKKMGFKPLNPFLKSQWATTLPELNRIVLNRQPPALEEQGQ